MGALGYREGLRSYRAVLEVKTLDLNAFGNPERQLSREGIVIYTLADPMQDPEHVDKLYGLYRQTNRDVPEVGHSDTLDRAAFEAHLKREDALPEAYHVVVYERRYVSYSERFRQRATALKLRGPAHAQQHGYTHVHTVMAPTNTAMVTLNTRLEFRPQATYITFYKDVL